MDNFKKVIRWSGRVLSILSIALLFMFFIGETQWGEPFVPFTMREMVLLAFFPFGVVLGMVLSWWHQLEGVGAAVSIVSLALFYLVDLLYTGTFPSGIFFLLFTLPAFFFALSAWLNRPPKHDYGFA